MYFSMTFHPNPNLTWTNTVLSGHASHSSTLNNKQNITQRNKKTLKTPQDATDYFTNSGAEPLHHYHQSSVIYRPSSTRLPTPSFLRSMPTINPKSKLQVHKAR
jgi:hypothetical protein